MERIPNLLSDSKLKVWLYNNKLKESRETEVVVQDDCLYCADYDQHFIWEEVGASPREALEIYIKRTDAYLCEVQREVYRARQELAEKYPDYPLLTEEEFKKKYPHLPLHLRKEDHNPLHLERLEKARARQHSRYDEPA